MKQKWPILIFSALLTAFIVLAGIWGNAQFQQLPSGGVLTAQQAAKGIAPDGWRQIAFVPDICTNTQQAQRLAQLCTQGQLEPIHLMDVIEDFVADPRSWP